MNKCTRGRKEVYSLCTDSFSFLFTLFLFSSVGSLEVSPFANNHQLQHSVFHKLQLISALTWTTSSSLTSVITHYPFASLLFLAFSALPWICFRRQSITLDKDRKSQQRVWPCRWTQSDLYLPSFRNLPPIPMSKKHKELAVALQSTKHIAIKNEWLVKKHWTTHGS